MVSQDIPQCFYFFFYFEHHHRQFQCAFFFFFQPEKAKRPVHALTFNIMKLGASYESNGDFKHILVRNREKRYNMK